ncbi:hypothetical protein sos41_01330 [Alphaproteobacteria bacterium SO-S41]|nr:hypothetical protein sos41_01330 [Alphaproteobacteria bacterium SO-S41]
MPRTYKPTGKRRGAPDGNANALKHGVHSAIEQAELLRANSASRAARALEQAMKLEDRRRALAAAEVDTSAEAIVKKIPAYDPAITSMFQAVKDSPNMRGVMIDMVREKAGLNWFFAFGPDGAPDWAFEWANVQPNAHQSPAFTEGDDLAPGVPGEGYTPQKNPGSIPPRRTKVDMFLSSFPQYCDAPAVTDEMAAAFLRCCPEFLVARLARAMLQKIVVERLPRTF